MEPSNKILSRGLIGLKDADNLHMLSLSVGGSAHNT